MKPNFIPVDRRFLDSGYQPIKRTGRTANFVVQIRRAVETDGKKTNEIAQRFEPGRVQQRSVGRHAGSQAKRLGPPQRLLQSRIDQRLATRERDRPITHRGGVIDQLADKPNVQTVRH